ncbi:transposase [Rhodophyticola sp. CCM32]|uniref:transposase n=1 Tax=Rhodophyticola sp. CCM32 TaxID=2916397 RepID=UPI00107F7B6B|nr:transposase [Rhodophyticola sp. CCM32]QBY00388.1 transposase [Rhodophyticola sp. CCM32]
MELRQRVVAHVEAGNTHHSAATRFDVSVKFVNDMVKLKRGTGSLAPTRQGHRGIGKLTPHKDWVRAQVDAKGEITLDEMAARLQAERGVSVAPTACCLKPETSLITNVPGTRSVAGYL